jgi:ribosomal protein S27E
MGVTDWFRRGTAVMMVACPDGTKSQIVWKHPDRTTPMKSQLTVDADASFCGSCGTKLGS